MALRSRCSRRSVAAASSPTCCGLLLGLQMTQVADPQQQGARHGQDHQGGEDPDDPG